MDGTSSEEFNIFETEQFIEEARIICGGLRLNEEDFDNVINGLRWALRMNPYVYPIVPNTKQLRLAKTWRVNAIPSMRIWFYIEESCHTVNILSIETLDVYL